MTTLQHLQVPLSRSDEEHRANKGTCIDCTAGITAPHVYRALAESDR